MADEPADTDTPDADDPADPDVPAAPPATHEEREQIARLLAGDEARFTLLVAQHHPSMRRVARGFVSSDALAEEVAQETWAAVLDGLARFEARSSLRTWIFRILVNRAKTRGVREARSVPMSALGAPEGDGPAVDADRFAPDGHWSRPPESFGEDDPETLLARHELGAALASALAGLPDRQRTVILLRDVDGWTSEEVCNVLGLSETNQRVLLHRARTRLRQALEDSQAR